MKLLLSNPPAGRLRERAFTMVEIVLSLAIIAVALVAIIGVLPIGLNVQSDNQEESIISADAAIWTQFLTKGAQGGNYFEPQAPSGTPGPIFYISEVRVDENVRMRKNVLLIDDPITKTTTRYMSNFLSASNLLGVLSLPKFPSNPFKAKYGEGYTNWAFGDTYTNWNVYADVRALNGNMADLGADMDFAFKYRMTPELVPLQTGGEYDYSAALSDTNNGTALPNIDSNLYELRLLFQWPLLPGPQGDYQSQTKFAKSMTFRTLVSGHDLLYTNVDTLYFMSPRQYSGIASAVPKTTP